jgi:hypothetical protein
MQKPRAPAALLGGPRTSQVNNSVCPANQDKRKTNQAKQHVTNVTLENTSHVQNQKQKSVMIAIKVGTKIWKECQIAKLVERENGAAPEKLKQIPHV